MKRFVITCFVLITFAANAQADFTAGLDAYTKKDYRTAIKEFKPLAEQGNTDAQFMLGYMYASGKGVLQDYVQAHVWFNLSAAQGNDKAAASRDKTAQVMTPQQIAEAQKIAREWKPTKALEKKSPKKILASDTVVPTGTELIRRIQENLGDLGYDPGPADGQMGSRTRWAIREYQKKEGLTIDGESTQALLEHLEKTREERTADEKFPQKAATSQSSKPPMGVRVAPEEQTQEVIDQLKKIVQKGDDERRADSHFLAELFELIRQYDWPWPNHIFHDDFQDGDFTRNPEWIIVSEDFWVDSSKRLVTRFRAAEQKRETAIDREEEDKGTRIVRGILSEILKEKGEKPSRPVQPVKAEAYVSVKTSNSFSMDIELLTLAGRDDDRLEIGFYIGTQRGEGYRLAYVGGRTPKLQLLRQSYRGSSIIEISKSVPLLNDGQAHVIKWQRYSDGNMIVAVDTDVIISTIDRTFQDSFDGISIVNHSGNYAISFIDVFGEQE